MSGLRRSATDAGRRWLRRTVGLWPLFELRNKVLGLPATRRVRRAEDREVARLRRELGRLPSATVATVVPTYRRPQLLQEAVRSALDQTLRDHVVLVVDDGAGLPPLPEDPRLFAVSLSRNTGVLGSVRNTGIRLTGSRYVAFLDDDNEWAPHHLETAVAALEDGADLVYTAVERYRSDGTRVDVLSRVFDRHALRDEDNYLDINAVVVRRGPRVLFSRVPRVKATLPKEDWEFVFRLSRRLRVRHVAVPTVRYLVNDESFYTSWPSEG